MLKQQWLNLSYLTLNYINITCNREERQQREQPETCVGYCGEKSILLKISYCPNMETKNEIDLCDDYGRLLNVNDVEPCKNGLELRLFQPRATYFVFLISRDEDGKIASIVPTVTDMGRTVGEVANRLRQQITKSKIKVHDFGLIGDILFLVFKNMYINLLFKLTRFNMIKFSTVNLKTKSDRCKQSLGG
ncbi:uncharacterized protein LOC126363724 isoform X2 [Schistocerca gregaria]|uniref:uncharacterized protein LOC126363724 isoform X2 n=1 Tax=Schistocerca gregaria TaxID=7010 RepID=UPI00211EA344|nr:uncharacterized protein LOC126363724 isoform X2 [Schistocerca gregaria]XP_049863946.1 uncharacterized protein LOC126363724 isoform X2 [Schistocerca gregaria]XP_049863947.1 uncharacterized protein LOC126363724 isoform X2 [Schistocerca gregaria]XP_049863948.1 uncharacterized protein LOC126363724 isoform X2 [Schistocerca gregaria]XP_049863949.1 uncharacterized protein LOC126363724 isoform X2 [Schistocerca gregaria]